MYQYDSLEKERADEAARLLQKYDELYFIPKVKELQKVCGDRGHSNRSFVFNQMVEGRWKKWYQCRNCYAKYGYQDL